MNVSRSGRVRKKSKFLTDSEFHTPKDSVIYGLSTLVSKNTAKENPESLNPASHCILISSMSGRSVPLPA